MFNFTEQTRNYVLSYTAVLLLIPFFLNLHRAHEIRVLILPFVVVACFLYWSQCAQYSWLYVFDVTAAVIMTGTNAWSIENKTIAFILFMAMSFGYILQRLLQKHDQVDWFLVLFSHLGFRYFGFALVMFSLDPNFAVEDAVLLTLTHIVHVVILIFMTIKL